MSIKEQIDQITSHHMREAIRHSGYLLEQRIEPIMTKYGFFMETNDIYRDSETGKSREVDVSAISGFQVYEKGMSFIFPVLICECENNAQPIVLFTKRQSIPALYDSDLKVSGIPVKLWDNDSYISLADFIKMDKFHHYWKGEVATQYCSFQLKKDKSSWIALHSEEQHDTLTSLIKAVDYRVDEHFKGWTLPEGADKEEINIQIYYPLLILHDNLFSANLIGNRLVLKAAEHLKYRKQFFSPYKNEVETYQIDIITEDYISQYMEIVKSEIERTKRVFQRNRKNIFESMKKVIQDAKKGGRELDSYRKSLEF